MICAACPHDRVTPSNVAACQALADPAGPCRLLDLRDHLMDCAKREVGAHLEPDELALLWPTLAEALGVER